MQSAATLARRAQLLGLWWPSRTHLVRSVCALLLLVTTASSAAIQQVFRVEVEAKDKTKVHLHSFAFDGKRAWVHFTSPGGHGGPEVRLTTEDGGATWRAVESDRDSCTVWNVDDLFQELGRVMSLAATLIDARLEEVSVKKIGEDAGPALQGLPTRHVRLEASARARASFLSIGFDYRLQVTGEAWTSPEQALHPIEQRWRAAMTHTGSPEIDSLLRGWYAELPGTILKQDIQLRLTDLGSHKVQTRTERIALESIETLRPEQLPAQPPISRSCDQPSGSDMRKALKYLLLGG